MSAQESQDQCVSILSVLTKQATTSLLVIFDRFGFSIFFLCEDGLIVDVIECESVDLFTRLN